MAEEGSYIKNEVKLNGFRSFESTLEILNFYKMCFFFYENVAL